MNCIFVKFVAQVDGFMSASTNSNVSSSNVSFEVNEYVYFDKLKTDDDDDIYFLVC
jgi:hypothetical protein